MGSHSGRGRGPEAGMNSRSDAIQLRYAAIVESSFDAIVSKNLDGAIVSWNAAAQRMFGYTEQEAIGQPITIIIPPDLHEEEHDILRRLRAGERIEHYETVRVTKAGRRIDVALTISPLRDSAGTIIGCSKTARDITEIKRAEAALRQSEERLARELSHARTLQSISARLISESNPESLYSQILDAAMELMSSDAASLQMLAADHATLRILASRGFHPDSAVFWHEVTVGAGSTCSKALSDNERVVVGDIEDCDFMSGTQDLREYRRSGIRAVQSTPLRSRSGRPLGMLSTHWRTPHIPTEEEFRFFDALARQAADLIERTLAEQAVRDAHEEERARIARELHDDINQRLAMVTMRLGFLKQGPPASAADLNQEIGEILREIVAISSDIQALSHDLHPPKLLGGLEAATTALCTELSNRHGVRIDVQIENIPNTLPPEIALCLYRVLQEALQNVVTHGESPHTHVSLKGHTDGITLTVKDSGAGFDPHEATRGPGLGLTSMRERLTAVGGQFSIESEPGRGTTMSAVVPLHLVTT